MKRVLVPLAAGFEEIEAATIIDVLRRAEIEVVVAGLSQDPILGSRNISLMADELLTNIQAVNFDMITLPGGAQGVANLQKEPHLISLVQQFHGQGKYVAAICAAPALLAAAGVLSSQTATSHPSVQSIVESKARYSNDRVVVDGQLITSRGPGTAMEFALTLVELLVGKEKREGLQQTMLVR